MTTNEFNQRVIDIMNSIDKALNDVELNSIKIEKLLNETEILINSMKDLDGKK